MRDLAAPVFLDQPINPESDESKSFRKYASLMRVLVGIRVVAGKVHGVSGAYPFEMHSAADELDALAQGYVNHHPLADCSYSLPPLGPGLARCSDRDDGGQDFEAVGVSGKLLLEREQIAMQWLLMRSVVAEVPNAMRLRREMPDKRDRLRYRRERYYNGLYSAAAHLWTHGVEMAEAIKIVSHAMSEVVGIDPVPSQRVAKLQGWPWSPWSIDFGAMA